MTDATRAVLVAFAALAVVLVRLSVIATREDDSTSRLVAELRLAQFAALLLVLIAGVYIGFALAQGSTTGSGFDVALAVGFLALAAIATIQPPGTALTLLAAAFAGHAVVDLMHSAAVLPSVALPNWYTSACAVYDVGIAGICYFPIVHRSCRSTDQK